MSILYSDALLLLSDLSNNGIDTKEQTKELVASGKVTPEILKFINDNRELDLTRFYEKIRKSYNHKKSNLYINIMKDIEDASQILTTLNSYSLQVVLFSKDLKDKDIFYKFARLQDVYQCLYYYSKTYDLIPCIKLLKMIKADIKTLETAYR